MDEVARPQAAHVGHVVERRLGDYLAYSLDVFDDSLALLVVEIGQALVADHGLVGHQADGDFSQFSRDADDV